MAKTQVTGSQIGPLDLTTEVTGVLPVANGGTGASSITSAGIVDTSSAQTLTGKTIYDGVVQRGTSGGMAASNIYQFGGSTAGQTLTLPAAASNTGGTVRVKNLASVNVSIASADGTNIYDGTSPVATVAVVPGESFDAVSDGFEWLVLSPRTISAPTIIGGTLAAGSTTVAPLKFTSGTNLTTAAAGAMEYDGATFAGTIDTTSGRGLSPVEQVFRLTSDAGAAIGATIADYFGTNSAFPYVAAGVYEIEWNLYYLKTTAGTVTYTITSTTAPVLLSAWYQQTVVGGVGTVGATQQAALVKSTSTGAVLPATGSLTTAVDHQAVVKALYVAHASSAGNVRLRVTESAGTVTPRAGSYYKVRRIPAGNVGTFVA